MSEENNQIPRIAGALAAPPPEDITDQDVPQPRQPTNLQGLLRFAMDATTKTEDSSSHALPIDEERKDFLDSALKAMSVDVIQSLKKSIKLLLNADKLTSNSDISEYDEAFDNILGHVHRIDTAIDFQKIGGFSIFAPCLNCLHPLVRSNACSVLAELCQNNPFCQQVVVESDLLELLLSMLERDSDLQVRVKALYAISCTVRENPDTTEVFLKSGGLKIVCKVLTEPDNRMRTKAAFLLTRLATAQSKIRDQLIANNIIPVLCHLISEPRMTAHEHVIALLWALVNENPVAIDICTQSELHLLSILKKHLRLADGCPEMNEEAQHCQLLLNVIQSFLPDEQEMDR